MIVKTAIQWEIMKYDSPLICSTSKDKVPRTKLLSPTLSLPSKNIEWHNRTATSMWLGRVFGGHLRKTGSNYLQVLTKQPAVAIDKGWPHNELMDWGLTILDPWKCCGEYCEEGTSTGRGGGSIIFEFWRFVAVDSPFVNKGCFFESARCGRKSDRWWPCDLLKQRC